MQALQSKVIESLHSLGHADLFGEPGKQPTQQQVENIQQVIDDHVAYGAGLIRTGRSVAPSPAFIKRSVNALFADKIVKSEKQKHLDALKKQSGRRTGGGSTVPLNLPANATPLEQSLAELPEMSRRVHGRDA